MPHTLARKIPLSVRRRAVAIHEAGHVVVAIILKRNVSHAVLNKPHGKSGKTLFAEDDLLLDLNIEKNHHVAEDYVKAALAGQVAEEVFWAQSTNLYNPKVDTQIYDDAEIGRIKKALQIGPDEDDRYMSHCRHETKKIVMDNRCQAAISDIATVLCRKFLINRSEIDAIMRRHGLI